MNRGHTAAAYLDLIGRLRRARPDLAVSGDFIVGFPGESEADFESTLGLVKAVGYASAFSFKYSRRPGTPAAALPKQVSEDEKSLRLAHLNALLADQQLRFNEAMVGRTTPVLFERVGRREGQVVGRSPYLQPVWVSGPASLVGAVVPVKIHKAGPGSLTGIMAEASKETPPQARLGPPAAPATDAAA